MFRLYDRIIDLELRYVDEDPITTARFLNPYLRTSKTVTKSINIKCPRNGRKPKITFDYKRVPGNVVYQANITITNLYLQIDSIKVDEIVVNAGYSSEYGLNMENFHCQVFNSFTPEPGPDGYTVFQCIIAQADVQLLEARKYLLQVYNNPKNWTVRDVFDEICSKMGMEGTSFALEELMQAQFTAKSLTPQVFDTGYALLGYFAEQVQTIAYQKWQHTIAVGIFDTSVYLIEYDSLGNVIAGQAEVRRRLVKLDLVSSVDWNAGTITIVAPWNPHVKPDSTISISPNYYKGSYALPNDIARIAAQRDTQDLYKVITQEVSFSTVDNTNQMTIMAVPIKYTGDQDIPEKLKNDAKDMYNVVQGQVAKEATLVKLGEESTEQQKTADIANDINKLTLDIPSLFYVVQPGDTLSDIVTKQGFEQLKGRYINGSEDCAAACNTWYPIIMALTNAKQLRKEPNYRINMQKPDDIRAGDWLALPSNPSWKNLWQTQKTNVINVCNTVIEYYEKAGKNAWVDNLRTVVNLFQNGVVL